MKLVSLCIVQREFISGQLTKHYNISKKHQEKIVYLIVHKKSTFGNYTFNGGSLVMWRSKKGNVVARISAAAEFQVKFSN